MARSAPYVCTNYDEFTLFAANRARDTAAADLPG
jgi:hypothetical protein